MKNESWRSLGQCHMLEHRWCKSKSSEVKVWCGYRRCLGFSPRCTSLPIGDFLTEEVFMFHTDEVTRIEQTQNICSLETCDPGWRFQFTTSRQASDTHTYTNRQLKLPQQFFFPPSCLFSPQYSKNSPHCAAVKSTEPSMSKPYLGGIHQRKQQAAFPRCTIMRHALRDTSICSTRPECNVTSCRIKDGPSLMSCAGLIQHITTGFWQRAGKREVCRFDSCLCVFGSPVEKKLQGRSNQPIFH